MQFQSRDGLKVEIHADNTLNSFCKFQKNINFEKDEHPNHHDVAILLTRCSDKICETKRETDRLLQNIYH